MFMKVIRTLIVDNSTDFRKRLRRFLDEQKEIEVIGEASDGHEAVESVKTLKPDLILLDFRMKRMDSLRAMLKMNNKMKKPKLIMLSSFDLLEYREAAQEMDASSYVIKRSIVDRLMPAIRETFSAD
jgi:DNA-binding NarL/FixJ family response regulator